MATVTATNRVALLSATVRTVAPQAELPPEYDREWAPLYRTSPTLRRWLIAVPARVVHDSPQLHLRLPRGWWRADTLTATYDRLCLLSVT
ncbi:MAG: hypothetical protein HKL89_05665 [Candidatus Dormibacteraeota bacterium]|nr:hypothetical protein [Candidatus Dormibacteraeota bacterium]